MLCININVYYVNNYFICHFLDIIAFYYCKFIQATLIILEKCGYLKKTKYMSNCYIIKTNYYIIKQIITLFTSNIKYTCYYTSPNVLQDLVKAISCSVVKSFVCSNCERISLKEMISSDHLA